MKDYQFIAYSPKALKSLMGDMNAPQLAEKSGVKLRVLYKWLNGESEPDLYSLALLGLHFNVFFYAPH